MTAIAKTQIINTISSILKTVLLCTTFTFCSSSQTMKVDLEDSQIPRDPYQKKELMIKQLEQNQIDLFQQLSAKAKDFGPYFVYAINIRNKALVDFLLSTENFSQNPDYFGEYFFYASLQNAPLELLYNMIKKGKELGWSIDQLDRFNRTPLTNAVIYGNPSAVQLLIDEGCRTVSGFNPKQKQSTLYQKLMHLKEQKSTLPDQIKASMHVLLSQKNKLVDLDSTFALRLVVLTDLTNEIPPLIFDGTEYDRTWFEEDNISFETKQALILAEKDYYEKQCLLLVDNVSLPVPLLSIIQDYMNPEDEESAAAEAA